MSATGERDRNPIVTIRHPEPSLGTLTLESGDGVIYDEATPDAWLQTGEDNYIELDGRWR